MYYEYLTYPFYVATLAAVAWTTWLFTQRKFIALKWSRDKRWDNRNGIVTFLFSYVTIMGTVLTGIAGMVYT